MSHSLLMDPSHVGRVPMRDHRDTGDHIPLIDARWVRYGYRYAGIATDDVIPLLTSDDKEPEGGDFQGALFWAHRPISAGDAARRCGSWWENAAAAIGAGGDEVLPLYDRSVVGDTRYKALDVLPATTVAKPPTDPLAWDNDVRDIHRRRIPARWPGIVMAGTKETSHELVFMPAGGALISQWRGPHLSDHSSLVYDLTDDGGLGVTAQLDTVWRVSSTTIEGGYALAWNLTASPDGGGFGAVYGTVISGGPVGDSAPGSVVVGGGALVGFMSAERSEFGAIHLGGGGAEDPYSLGVNKDGEPTTVARLSLRAIYGPPGTNLLTGPKRHDGEGPDAAPGPKFYRVFHWQDPATKEHIWVSTSQLAPPDDGGGSGGPVLTGSSAGVDGLATPNALCTTDQYGRPTATWLEGRDQRYVQQYVPQPMEPVTWHEQAFGTYRPNAIGNAARFATTTYDPDTQRRKGGTGSGGKVGLPPELDLAHVRTDNPAALPNYSTTTYGVVRARWAIGKAVDLDAGTIVDGWLFDLNGSGDLLLTPLDENGTEDTERAVTINGGLDASAIRRNVRTITASATAAFGDLMALNGSSGLTVTLPAGTVAMIGHAVDVVNISNYAGTVEGPSSETIGDGASTSLVVDPGESYTLVLITTNDWRIL